ncbi:hypothetical protein B0O99DRAFT_695707 [Bisporella sp. PMI_857]|nr:hypothetical protein B0O99DRAFT_695707 [Bisporella sp. PMI_857]
MRKNYLALGIDDMKEIFAKLIDRTRIIVLGAYNLGFDMKVFHALKFGFQTSIVGILDTDLLAKMAGTCSDVPKRRLQDISAQLGCPVEGCHIAGNDTNFALQAMLLLAAEIFYGLGGLLDDSVRPRLKKIKSVRLFPVPQYSSLPQKSIITSPG